MRVSCPVFPKRHLLLNFHQRRAYYVEGPGVTGVRSESHGTKALV